MDKRKSNLTEAPQFSVSGRRIGPGEPTYLIAEMSANHNQNFEQAVRIIQAAKECGADAIKLQTYTANTLTIKSDSKYFRVGEGSLWSGKNLFDLYDEAHTPWEWQPKLMKVAQDLGLDFFSTPFDATAIEFLEKMDVPLYKIASPELIDIPLIKLVAKTGKPIIMSTGMATLPEITEAVEAIRESGNPLALLKCTSAYPAPPEEMNIRTIPDMAHKFGVVAGLSDHTMGIAVAVAAVAMGASIIEKHLTLSREDSGPDSAFSLEPHEFKAMVDSVRVTEKALGKIYYGFSEKEGKHRMARRSLFVVADIKAGEKFTEQNVRSIRPAYGLAPKHLPEILGLVAKVDLERGTPLAWDDIVKN